MKDADDRATEARLTAEKTFAEAEHKMNSSIARRGTEEALASYVLREEAIAAAQDADGSGQKLAEAGSDPPCELFRIAVTEENDPPWNVNGSVSLNSPPNCAESALWNH